MAALGEVTVIVFLVFFLLQSGPRMAARLVAVAGTPSGARWWRRMLADVNAQVQRFLLVHAFTAAIVAVATWSVLAWMGVANAVLWGVLAGVFNSIPYFGPVVVSGGMFLVGLVQQGGASEAWQMAGGGAAHHLARRLAAHAAADGPGRAHERAQRVPRSVAVDLALGRLGHAAGRADAGAW